MSERLRAALVRIAAFDDEGANAHLAKYGTYSSFDEPGSVQIAREALAVITPDEARGGDFSIMGSSDTVPKPGGDIVFQVGGHPARPRTSNTLSPILTIDGENAAKLSRDAAIGRAQAVDARERASIDTSSPTPSEAAQALAKIAREAGWNWQAGPDITLFVPLDVMRAFAVAMLEDK